MKHGRIHKTARQRAPTCARMLAAKTTTRKWSGRRGRKREVRRRDMAYFYPLGKSSDWLKSQRGCGAAKPSLIWQWCLIPLQVHCLFCCIIFHVCIHPTGLYHVLFQNAVSWIIYPIYTTIQIWVSRWQIWHCERLFEGWGRWLDQDLGV